MHLNEQKMIAINFHYLLINFNINVFCHSDGLHNSIWLLLQVESSPRSTLEPHLEEAQVQQLGNHSDREVSAQSAKQIGIVQTRQRVESDQFLEQGM